MEFEYNLPVHIVFGRGCIEQLGSEAAKLGKRALLVTGRSRIITPTARLRYSPMLR